MKIQKTIKQSMQRVQKQGISMFQLSGDLDQTCG